MLLFEQNPLADTSELPDVAVTSRAHLSVVWPSGWPVRLSRARLQIHAPLKALVGSPLGQLVPAELRPATRTRLSL